MPMIDLFPFAGENYQTKTTSSGDFMARSGSYATGANQVAKNIGLALANFQDKVSDIREVVAPQPTAQAVSVHHSKPEVDYMDADIAKAYGMDASTAYQEALSNTQYQRAVADLQAAGLNPVLAAGKVAGAGGVYTADVNGSPSAGVSSAAGAHDKWKELSNLGSIIGAGAGFFAGGNVRSAYLGSKVGSAVLGAVGNLLDAG